MICCDDVHQDFQAFLPLEVGVVEIVVEEGEGVRHKWPTILASGAELMLVSDP